MALNFGIEPPQWLQNESAWNKGISHRGVNELMNMAALVMRSKSEQMNQKQSLLGLQQQEQALELGELKISGLNQDYNEIPNWLKEHPTWESRQSAQWPLARTAEGNRMIDNIRLQDAQSIQAKTLVEATHDFAKRVDALRQVDPGTAGQFAPYISGRPNPTILQALGMAEEAVQVRKQNQSDLARIEAQARGDVPTTTITDKGVSTTFKPAPASENDTPQTMAIDGGVTLAWMPGGKSIHVINPKGEKNVLTPFQLKSIAEGLKRDDPRRTQINEFLANTAASQTVPQPAAAPAPSSAPEAAPKILKYNPASRRLE